MGAQGRDFARAARQALADSELQGAIARATGRMADGRCAAFADWIDGEALRDRARDIQEGKLERLDALIDSLERNVQRAGGVVHRARDAAHACAIVLTIARARGARLAVKSKSMTTEEIDLDRALLGAGIERVETDLGEYILQLAGEKPSHLIAPAIHKSREQIADLFADAHGTTRTTDPEALTREARERLRAAFLAADVGVSGVNFAVAETGTLVIVENEGNARLTTTLPGCHIAVMGMEKVIPDLAALCVLLRLLARSATGQKMSSYVSLLRGPRRAGELDGPEELHLVVLDNGRSRLLADPELRESLRCIRCGACLNVCPVYRRAGGHAYGWVYPGPIGAVIDPTLVGYDRAGALPFASTLCGACRDVCPVRIDLPRLLVTQRERAIHAARGAVRDRLAGATERAMARVVGVVMSHPALYRASGRLVRFLLRSAWAARLPGLSSWARARVLPDPPRQTFRERWSARRG
jgi:L-lactate dehydrogenase complex protein LldF